MTKQEKEEYILYLIDLYDQWIEKEENRGISYGEIAFIQYSSTKELRELEKALNEVLNYE